MKRFSTTVRAGTVIPDENGNRTAYVVTEDFEVEIDQYEYHLGYAAQCGPKGAFLGFGATATLAVDDMLPELLRALEEPMYFRDESVEFAKAHIGVPR